MPIAPRVRGFMMRRFSSSLSYELSDEELVQRCLPSVAKYVSSLRLDPPNAFLFSQAAKNKLVKTSPSKRKNRALLAAMIQCAEGQSYFSPEGILAPPPSASDDKDVETLPVARTISRMTLHEWEDNEQLFDSSPENCASLARLAEDVELAIKESQKDQSEPVKRKR